MEHRMPDVDHAGGTQSGARDPIRGRLYGGFAGEPLDDESREYVFVARR
jgi:hypothetical protein